MDVGWLGPLLYLVFRCKLTLFNCCSYSLVEESWLVRLVQIVVHIAVSLTNIRLIYIHA